jgi:hypothetical protein
LAAEIQGFVRAIGATEPTLTAESAKLYKQIFKRKNYFVLNHAFLVIKLSRSRKPFWGLTRGIYEVLQRLRNSYLVLLIPGNEGWVYSIVEVENEIQSANWRLDGSGQEYKINFNTLKDQNAFYGVKHFYEKLGIKS